MNRIVSELEYKIKDYPDKDITEKIISCAIQVHSALGPGLLEGVYEEALAYEFDLREIKYQRQKEINLLYKGKGIGIHRVDFIVEGEVILELKASEGINPVRSSGRLRLRPTSNGVNKIYEAQVLTYLKATRKRVGLLINFNVERLKEGIRRLIV